MQILIRILLFLNIFVMVYLFIKQLVEKSRDVLANNDISNSMSDMVYKNVGFYKPKISLIKRIEIIILKSNIRKYLSFITPKFILVSSIFIGVAVFVITYKLLNNIITSTILFGIFGFIPIYILEIMSSYNNLKIERNFLYFLNILMNFAQLKDDVNFAFKKSVTYVEEPLKSYCNTFIEEVKRGLPIEEGLDNFKDKLENSKFKLFLKNAQLVVKHGGSFLSLATSNLEIIKQLQMEKARRKSETAIGRLMIFVMMGINIALAIYMFGLYPDTLEKIRTDFYGQVIVLVNTTNLFIVFYLSLRLQKLDY